MLALSQFPCIADALRDAMLTYTGNDALIEVDRSRENRRWTYAEVHAEAERFAARLQQAGVGPGDRVAIIMQNQSRWLISATAAFWAGAVLVPIDYKLSPQEQLPLLAHCGAKVLVTEATTWPKLKAADHAQSQPTLASTAVFLTEAAPSDELGASSNVHRWEDKPSGEFRAVPRKRDDVACVVYSSGTSGTPKGCQLTHDNYLRQAEILGQLYPIGEQDRYFSVLPTNHAIDFMVGYLLPLLFGASVVHQRTLRPQYLRSTLKEYGVTHMSLVPTILKNLERRLRDRIEALPFWQRKGLDTLVRLNDLATARAPNHRLSRTLLKPIADEFGGRLRMIFAGGAMVDRKMAEFFYSLGIPVVIGYGLTEASTVVSVNDLKPFRADSVGRPVPGVDVEIRHPNTEGVGEVWVRGPTVMRGYLDAPELTDEVIVDGWLCTGDLGKLDASGHLKLLGRKKNMIVTEGGKNIYPEDVEANFDGLPECDEFCVFAANYIWPKRSMSGERLVAVVRPQASEDGSRKPSAALLHELRTRNRQLPDFKRVEGLVVRDEAFPVTASLKVKRHELAGQLRGEDESNAVIPLQS